MSVPFSPTSLVKKAVKKRSLLTGLLNVDFWNYFFFNIRYLKWGENRNIFFVCHCTKPAYSTLQRKRGYFVCHGIILKFYKKYSVMLSFSPSFMSNSLRPHGLQHTRLSCPSTSPGACSNSCPMSWWCHPTISSSVIPFSSCLQSFPASRSFLMSQFFASGGQSYWNFSFSISLSNKYSGLISFRMDWFDLLAIQGILRSLHQHHSSQASILWCSAFYTVQLSHPCMTTGKTISLTRQTFVSKAMSLVFNTLSRNKCLLISWLQSWSTVILEPEKINSVTVSIVFPSICHEVMGPDAMIFIFWMLSVFYPQQANFFTLHFHFQEALQFLFAFCPKGGVICISWGYWYFS